MNKKLLLITVIATALLLSCSNKNTTGVGYKDNSASSSNEAILVKLIQKSMTKKILQDIKVLGKEN